MDHNQMYMERYFTQKSHTKVAVVVQLSNLKPDVRNKFSSKVSRIEYFTVTSITNHHITKVLYFRLLTVSMFDAIKNYE